MCSSKRNTPVVFKFAYNDNFLHTTTAAVENIASFNSIYQRRIKDPTNHLCRGRSSQMFFKIGVVKKFANLTRKHLSWSLFLIKLQG